jgi:hypothetical protein
LSYTACGRLAGPRTGEAGHGADLSQKVLSRYPGHDPVQNDHVKGLLLKNPHGLFSVDEAFNAVPVLAQEPLQIQAMVLFVVNDQDFAGAIAVSGKTVEMRRHAYSLVQDQEIFKENYLKLDGPYPAIICSGDR